MLQFLSHDWRSILRWIVPFSIVFLLDQVSKSTATHFGSVVMNEGVSFGLKIPNELILAVAVVYVFLLKHFKKFGLSMMWIGIICGAIWSNLFDRLMYGSVRDWITISVFGSSVKNNLADFVLVFSAIALIAVQYRHERQRNQASTKDSV